jgi:peptide deformylase
MLRTMEAAKGVGLAAPQVGLYIRAATLKLDYKTDTPRTLFVRNPKILERSDETVEGYEMCLSIPGIGGLVRRSRWIKIVHTSLEGRELTTEAEGHNAVLWQHELDHLDGVLYVDKVIGELLPADEVRRRRKQQDERPSALWPGAADSAFAAADYPEGTSLVGG